MKPRLLDLFCGAGGASMGYSRAGFEVVGVDINPQPNYPFEFHKWDALTTSLEPFDFIHASPPCQAYSCIQSMNKWAKPSPHLIEPIRELLLRWVDNSSERKIYVIENVPGSPLVSPVKLCGSSFGLGVRRHRFFESNACILTPPCQHNQKRPIAVYGDHPEDSTKKINRARTLAEGQEAMGIDWMTWPELTQAIPPAYTQYIGEQLIAIVAERKKMNCSPPLRKGTYECS